MFVSVTFERIPERMPGSRARYFGPLYSPTFNSEWDSWKFSKEPQPKTADELARFFIERALKKFECRPYDLRPKSITFMSGDYEATIEI